MRTSRRSTISIVVSYTYPYIGSGIGNVAQKQAELLVEAGHKVYLHSSNFPKSKDSFMKNGVNYIKFPALFFLEKLHVPVPLTLLSFNSLKTLIHSDVVHVHDGLYLSSFFAVAIAKLFHKKVIITVHISHIPYKNKIVDALERLAEYIVAKPTFLSADSILLINDELADDFSTYGKKVRILPNGVDTDLFHSVSAADKNVLRRRLGIEENKKIVLFVGRLVPKKGFDLLLQASSSDYELLFVGGGEIKPEYRKIPGTHWIGAVTPDRLAEYYQMSDVFILPSYGEGYPLSIKEAIASGLPVITTFRHTTLTPLKDKIVYFVTPDVDQIKESITKVLKAPRIQSTEKLRAIFLNQFSWSNNIHVLESIYKNATY